MKNSKIDTQNFRLDLITLILLILFLGVNVVNAQDDLKKGIEIFEKKNYYGAKKFFGDYLKANPEHAEAFYYLGRIAMEEKDLELATEYFDKATDIDETNSDYFTWKGIAYVQLLSTVDFMRQGIYASKAMNALEKAVDLNPNNIDARMWLAGYYAQAPVFAGGSKEKTGEQYQAILNIDPTFVPAYINYGLTHTEFEEYDLALEYFRNALKYDPENYAIYLYIGKLSAESGKFASEGERALNTFIESAPEELQDSMDEAWWYLGTIYLQVDDTENARKAYEKAIALNPEREDYQKSLKKLM
jgi:tetratricopeptide (TPR) repeat protein